MKRLVPLVLFTLSATSLIGWASEPATLHDLLASSSTIRMTLREMTCRCRSGLFATVSGSDVGGYVANVSIDGYLNNGQEVMVVPLGSGGSGGIFDSLLFIRLNGKVRFIGYVPSANGHLDIALADGALRVRTPIYRIGDPQCCPLKPHYEIDTLRGIRLVKLNGWDDGP